MHLQRFESLELDLSLEGDELNLISLEIVEKLAIEVFHLKVWKRCSEERERCRDAYIKISDYVSFIMQEISRSSEIDLLEKWKQEEREFRRKFPDHDDDDFVTEIAYFAAQERNAHLSVYEFLKEQFSLNPEDWHILVQIKGERNQFSHCPVQLRKWTIEVAKVSTGQDFEEIAPHVRDDQRESVSRMLEGCLYWVTRRREEQLIR
eukprot:TRINITY_DN8482_c0_g1_i14.p1 TRINITY_DN8482_c0_g1~~TRINITY_DN8482_c0_g1_i14.p1  ORF type:complete len:206 (-),score=52.78 TRINITY_DN8482_c0_g1_i14:1121-1738(-)